MSAQCCVVGGGPGGMMLGLLLARAGIDVAALEDFMKLPHQEVHTLVRR